MCKTVYRVTEEAVESLGKWGELKRGLSVGRRPCICPCMGRLIEGGK